MDAYQSNRTPDLDRSKGPQPSETTPTPGIGSVHLPKSFQKLKQNYQENQNPTPNMPDIQPQDQKVLQPKKFNSTTTKNTDPSYDFFNFDDFPQQPQVQNPVVKGAAQGQKIYNLSLKSGASGNTMAGPNVPKSIQKTATGSTTAQPLNDNALLDMDWNATPTAGMHQPAPSTPKKNQSSIMDDAYGRNYVFENSQKKKAKGSMSEGLYEMFGPTQDNNAGVHMSQHQATGFPQQHYPMQQQYFSGQHQGMMPQQQHPGAMMNPMAMQQQQAMMMAQANQMGGQPAMHGMPMNPAGNPFMGGMQPSMPPQQQQFMMQNYNSQPSPMQNNYNSAPYQKQQQVPPNQGQNQAQFFTFNNQQ